MIKQVLISFLFCVSLCSVSAQNVQYYKLQRVRSNGTDDMNVSGGQFITFTRDLCFETTKGGSPVGHGTLKRNDNYSNSHYTVYQGSSYWGSSTTFKFNADKSVLNVVLDNGDIYVYKRATPPAGQTTCSLIRKQSSGSSSKNGSCSGGGYVPTYNPSPPAYQPTPISPQSNPNSNSGNPVQPHQVTESCPVCLGSGKCNTCNGKHWYYFAGNQITCPNCKPNGACSSCGGSGKKTSTKYY